MAAEQQGQGPQTDQQGPKAEGRLRVKELEILMEALDSWVRKGDTSHMLMSMIELVMPEELLASPTFQAKRFEQQDDEKKHEQQRYELAAMIKAKLVIIKRDILSREEVKTNA